MKSLSQKGSCLLIFIFTKSFFQVFVHHRTFSFAIKSVRVSSCLIKSIVYMSLEKIEMRSSNYSVYPVYICGINFLLEKIWIFG